MRMQDIVVLVNENRSEQHQGGASNILHLNLTAGRYSYQHVPDTNYAGKTITLRTGM
jgi:hypothetical protein